MPHDATPPNGRMYRPGLPGWIAALALAVAFSAAAVAMAFATGLFVILPPALAVVALGYALYAAIGGARRRRADIAWDRIIGDGRAPRRHPSRHRP